MDKKISQQEMVLSHLQRWGSITSVKAFKRYGITRLAEYIRRLRADGYNIETTYRKKGKKIDPYCTYVLKGE